MEKSTYSFQDKMNSCVPDDIHHRGELSKKYSGSTKLLSKMDEASAVNALVTYLDQFKNKLPELYDWKFSLDGLYFISDDDKNKLSEISNSNNYEKVIKLKSILPKYLDLNHSSYKQAIDWIIKEWGGIKTGSKISQKQYNSLKNSRKLASLPFNRIASFSKPAAFISPDKCIIYDSRVAYSINWILLSSRAKHKFFPIPEGRNSKMKAFDMNTLIHLAFKENYFSENDQEENKRFISNRDKQVYLEKECAYEVLNSLISEVSKELWKGDPEKQINLFYTEMLLFSIADTIIFQDIIKRSSLKIN